MDAVNQKKMLLSKWGWMCYEHLKNHRSDIYFELKELGELHQYCYTIQEQAIERKERMMAQAIKANPISEDLKNTDPLKWVAHMNSLKFQVEEIIKAELIFV